MVMVSHDNDHTLTDRWLRVLRLAAIHDAGWGLWLLQLARKSAPPSSAREAGGMYLDCVHSAGISYSSAGDRVTASPDSLVLLDFVSVRSCLSFEGKQGCYEELLPGLLFRLEYYTRTKRFTVNVCITSGAMASSDSGGSHPRVDHHRVTFRMESYVNLDSPGVVKLDTSVVSDVLGLRAHYQNARPTRVLPGRAQNSVCVLIPDVHAVPRGFHDVTLVDMAGETGPEVLKEEMGYLRRQWPASLLTGMSRRQTDLETQRREC